MKYLRYTSSLLQASTGRVSLCIYPPSGLLSRGLTHLLVKIFISLHKPKPEPSPCSHFLLNKSKIAENPSKIVVQWHLGLEVSKGSLEVSCVCRPPPRASTGICNIQGSSGGCMKSLWLVLYGYPVFFLCVNLLEILWLTYSNFPISGIGHVNYVGTPRWPLPAPSLHLDALGLPSFPLCHAIH